MFFHKTSITAEISMVEIAIFHLFQVQIEKKVSN